MSSSPTQPASVTVSAFRDVVHARRSPRRFSDVPMSPEDIRGVLEDAQAAPSNANTQPWVVHVVSGRRKDALSAALLAAEDKGRFAPDYTMDYGQGTHLQRSRQHGATLYGAWGVERSDHEGRRNVMRANLAFYGAPHAALLFMPVLGDSVRTAGDVGMYAQNFLLALTARGFQGIPQTALGVFADTTRQVLGVPEDLKLLFGISFGSPDTTTILGGIPMGRLPLHESVVLHDTPGVLTEP